VLQRRTSALLYPARETTTTTAWLRGERVPGTLFSVPGTSSVRSYSLSLSLSRSFCPAAAFAASGAAGEPNGRTNGEFDDPSAGPDATSSLARHDVLFECEAGLGRGSPRAGRHRRYPSCRWIPRFVNIPPNRLLRERPTPACPPASAASAWTGRPSILEGSGAA